MPWHVFNFEALRCDALKREVLNSKKENYSHESLKLFNFIFESIIIIYYYLLYIVLLIPELLVIFIFS